MTSELRVAEAVAFFENCDDRELLMGVIRDVAPRARKMSTAAGLKLGDENVPGPADIAPADQPASKAAALETVRKTDDFPLLQALARAAGRRIEQLAEEAKP